MATLKKCPVRGTCRLPAGVWSLVDMYVPFSGPKFRAARSGSGGQTARNLAKEDDDAEQVPKDEEQKELYRAHVKLLTRMN